MDNQQTITVYKKDLGPDNKQENATDIVQRKIRTDFEGTRYVKYENEFYKVHGAYVIFLDEEFEPVKQYRTVYSSHSDVAHAWAHHLTSEDFADYGRSSDGRVYYEGTSIYSYGSHFEMARILPNVPGQEHPVVLINSATYSNSTSGHQSHVSMAIPHEWTTVRINPYELPNNNNRYYRRSATLFDYGPNSEMKETYRAVIDWICETIESERERATRRLKLNTLRSSIRQVRSLQNKGRKFIDIFQCKSVILKSQWDVINKPVFDSKEEFWDKARAVIERKLNKRKRENTNRIAALQEAGIDFNPDEMSHREIENLYNKEKRRVYAQKKVKEIKEKLDNIRKWKQGDKDISRGEVPSIPWDISKQELEELTGETLPDLAPVYLRKHPSKPDTVQTSKYVDLSVDEIRKANLVYERYGEEAIEQSSGPEDFISINGRIKLSSFTSVPAVNSEGTFRFGCHKVIPSEREYILKATGLK